VIDGAHNSYKSSLLDMSVIKEKDISHETTKEMRLLPLIIWK